MDHTSDPATTAPLHSFQHLHNGLFIMILCPKSVAQLVKAYGSGHGVYGRSLCIDYLEKDVKKMKKKKMVMMKKVMGLTLR